MFHRVGWTFSLWGVLAASTAIIAAPPPPSAGEPVSLYLRPGVTLDGPVVTVGDVAAMEGGAVAYRQWLAALDLADLSPAKPALEISKEQVAFRLRLAGATQFQLLGAKQTRARLAEAGAPEPPAAFAIKQAALRHGLETMPQQGTMPQQEPKPPESPVLIKARDQVHLLVRVGPLRLTTLCEAVQEGRAGQMIRVRNVDSRAERVGRVVDRNTVELDQEGSAP